MTVDDEGFIDVRGLEKSFTVRRRGGFLRRTAEEVRAVDGISFALRRGEMAGLHRAQRRR